MTDPGRPFDVVLFGATGYTGRLVAEQLARAARDRGARFALAGRNERKLAAVRDGLGLDVPLRVADATDDASLRAVARETRVVLSTVGPYVEHGMPLVDACVAEGTDYADITGEPEFVARTMAKHGRGARAKQLRVVSCCGLDSIPTDLGVLFTVRQLEGKGAITVRGHVRGAGGISGGTWNSGLLSASRWRELRSAVREAKAELARSGEPDRARGLRQGLHWEPRLSAWAAPLPMIDGSVVLRSARALPDYGTDFRYGHFVEVRRASTVVAGGLGAAAFALLAQVPATREMLGKLRPSGAGPTAEQLARGSFRITFLAESDRGERVTTRVSGGELGYVGTAKMACASALCLALEREVLPDRFGVLTPAATMGDVLRPKLEPDVLAFEVLDRG